MDNRDEKFEQLEKMLYKTSEDVAVIKTMLTERANADDAKNKALTERVNKLENNQDKLVWLVIISYIGAIGSFIYRGI